VIAQSIWQGFEPAQLRTDSYYYDAFDNPDPCTQEFTDWAGQCWVDGGEPGGFDAWIGDDGWYRLLKDTDNNVSHWVERRVGDVAEKSAVWLSFKHRRTGMDDSGDRVGFLVYDPTAAMAGCPAGSRWTPFRALASMSACTAASITT
jgi:hypothetical protein